MCTIKCLFVHISQGREYSAGGRPSQFFVFSGHSGHVRNVPGHHSTSLPSTLHTSGKTQFVKWLKTTQSGEMYIIVWTMTNVGQHSAVSLHAHPNFFRCDYLIVHVTSFNLHSTPEKPNSHCGDCGRLSKSQLYPIPNVQPVTVLSSTQAVSTPNHFVRKSGRVMGITRVHENWWMEHVNWGNREVVLNQSLWRR